MVSLTLNKTNEIVEDNDLPIFKNQLIALLPLALFFLSCMVLFTHYMTYDMHVLAGSAFLGLMITGLLATNKEKYWEAVLKGIASKESVTIFLLLLLIGMFSQMIKVSGLSNGLIWFAQSFHFSAAGFIAFTFVAVCIVATSTGSSIGTMFAAFPVFFHTGSAIGVDGAMLAGAIVSGCIFGDNLAPISDTTIASASTQVMQRSGKSSDIGGVVRSRFKYSIIAAVITVGFYLLIAAHHELDYSKAIEHASAFNLLMLLPVLVLLVISKLTNNIFIATSLALAFGIVLGLISGIFDINQVFHSDGTLGNHATGFLADGIQSMMGTAVLVVSIFGIMGIIRSAKVVESLTDRLMRSAFCQTQRGFEIVCAVVVNIVTILFGGVTSATILTVGPIINEAGQRLNIHPYRRANMLDGFANTLGVVIPFFSVFVFISSALSSVSPNAVAGAFIYPIVLFVVLLLSVLTGFGRKPEF
ncbi:Na+/H+ antiporter NhaC family protein [Vibrio nitrifigilis]|uniref:Na+/H+ antiporter NhaC family protein n=1 Tax=Vibrio nitrifigilis TaxID=2789781 RepID=A0ABS0GK76_9VIBR|nr:Na+/H+ antiporter NhaC family protein [Vibrio nitrifigilis]MBF9002865.1 Na+/H+ antiporter NhaC family protein [Vibrio nitrifigilis]